MEKYLLRMAGWFDLINDWIGEKVAWLTSALVLLFCYDVLTRYFFNTTRVWIGEMEWHLYSLIFLLAAGYALRHDRHVRVDLFYANFSDRRKAWVNLIGTLLLLLPWTLVVIYTSWSYAAVSFGQLEGSPNPGGLPFRFLIKGAIFVGFVLLLLQGISDAIRSAFVLTGTKPDETSGDKTQT